jgi:adenosylcobyric acid synthase
MNARALFVGGTSSNAGKSWMATAICAWLRRQGVAVAPFKAQNMSNNSYPCRGGGEIGRAQVVQAEACGLEPEPAMNPILLKPDGAGSSQVIVNGRLWKTLPPRGYYQCTSELRPHVLAAYDDLSRRFDVVIIEGAGSVSELNLRSHDLVNLGLVTSIRAPWILVADIERGGVFASVIGTHALLTDDERSLFRGFAINKFRGDVSLFEEGAELLEQRIASRCLGIFPHLQDAAIDAEDTLVLPTMPRTAAPPGARTAIVRLPSISNFTDFRHLSWAEWMTAPDGDYDFVILPGSKNTLHDLAWLRAQQLDEWILAQHARGATIVGVCGGFQMLGRSISDPMHVESAREHADGLGLLPVDTILAPGKTTIVRQATTRGGVAFTGYEIHVGETIVTGEAAPFATLEDGRREGACADRVVGTYLHGALEHPGVCAEIFGVPIAAPASKQASYDRLADWFAQHVRHVETLGLC